MLWIGTKKWYIPLQVTNTLEFRIRHSWPGVCVSSTFERFHFPRAIAQAVKKILSRGIILSNSWSVKAREIEESAQVFHIWSWRARSSKGLRYTRLELHPGHVLRSAYFPWYALGKTPGPLTCSLIEPSISGGTY